MDMMEKLRSRASAIQRQIAFPEADEKRVLYAARQIQNQGIAKPVLVGNPKAIGACANSLGIVIADMPILEPKPNPLMDDYIASYRRRRPEVLEKAARQLLEPLFYSAMLLKADEVDAMIAGATHTTARVIKVGLMQIGLAAKVQIPSSFFLMVIPARGAVPARTLLFADCAVTVDPNPSELADIAIASAYSAHSLLGQTPYVALLSFSTRGSARHAHVDKVREAVEIARQRAPDLAIDGELQVDSAIIAAVAAKKVGDQSVVAGRANVLVFPDLNAGNIGYKLTQYTAGAQAIGPILQGFARPLSDLSRGAAVDDIVATATVIAASCNG